MNECNNQINNQKNLNEIFHGIKNIPTDFSITSTKKSTTNFINHHSQKVIYKGSQKRNLSIVCQKAWNISDIEESSLFPRRECVQGQARHDGKQKSNIILEYIDTTVNFIKGKMCISHKSSDKMDSPSIKLF